MVKDWLSTPTNLEISSRTIDVWRCPLDLAVNQIETLSACLSAQERQRADKFRFEHSRHQFVTTRARLRQCLALATGKRASEIEFELGPSGKPFLAGNSQTSELQFNVSHTDSLALIAITRGQRIGIDVESLTRNVQHNQVSQNFFSATEKAAIAALPDDQAPASFFACWTRKEAVLKAIGTGIAHGLDSFAVATDPEIVHCRTELQSEDGSVETWRVESLSCGAGFMGALAYQHRPAEIRYWY